LPLPSSVMRREHNEIRRLHKRPWINTSTSTPATGHATRATNGSHIRVIPQGELEYLRQICLAPPTRRMKSTNTWSGYCLLVLLFYFACRVIVERVFTVDINPVLVPSKLQAASIFSVPSLKDHDLLIHNLWEERLGGSYREVCYP